VNWGTLPPAGWFVGLSVGLFTGIVSGLLGIGGGNIMVPASTILLDLTQHQAQGVSLLVIIPTAISGAWSHYRRGNVRVRVAALLAIGAMLGGFIGARIALLLPADQLRIVFGLILSYFALRYLGVEAWLRVRLSPKAPAAVTAATSPPPAPPPVN
jgi:uncharacterized membrane protein YfcA